jgi:bacterioferritin
MSSVEPLAISNLQKLDPLRIGQTLRETMECDLAGEHDARTLCIEAPRQCDAMGDYVSRAVRRIDRR